MREISTPSALVLRSRKVRRCFSQMFSPLLIVAFVLLLVASFVDVRTREIPDWISLAVVLVAVLAASLGSAGIRWWMVVSGAAAGLLIGYSLFRFCRFGGGDAKLITALGALLGPVGLLFLVFWMSIAGGVLAVIAIARGQRDYAYAPAIAAGFAAYLVYPCGVWRVLM